MTEENDPTLDQLLDAEETSEETSLTDTIAPIALMAAAAAGTVYLVRKFIRRHQKNVETEDYPLAIETTSSED